MKHTIHLLIAFLLFTSNVMSQEKNISSIIPSSSPAFTILGTTPTDISRPNNWNALQTSLYESLVSNNSFIIPKDLSLEFYPYWLKDHPTFTYKDYLNSSGFSLRNAAISIASAKTQYGKDSAQCMGLGFRIPVITGNRTSIKKINQGLVAKIDAYRTTVLQWQSDFQFFLAGYPSGNTMKQFFADVAANLAAPPLAPPIIWVNDAGRFTKSVTDTLKLVFDANNDLYSSHEQKIEEIASVFISNMNLSTAIALEQEISDALKKVTQLEISGATSIAFPTEKFNFSKAARLALWASYSFDINKNGKINGTAALRYIHDFEVDTVKASNNIDGILRLNFTFGSNERFNISVLGNLRFRSAKVDKMIINGNKFYRFENDMDNKLVVDLSVKLTESIAFSYSIGKNYGKDLFTVPNSLISFFNIFYGLNTKLKPAKDKAGNDSIGFTN